MGELIYIDTCVYLDYFGNRIDKLRPLGEFAFEVIKRVIDCEFVIVFSDWILYELYKYAKKEAVDSLIITLKEANKIKIINKTKTDIMLARKLSKNWHDGLHAILANRARAKYLITRNHKDFEDVQYLIQTKFPEEL